MHELYLYFKTLKLNSLWDKLPKIFCNETRYILIKVEQSTVLEFSTALHLYNGRLNKYRHLRVEGYRMNTFKIS